MTRVLTAILLIACVPAQAALLGRAPLTPGGYDYQAYYDTNLNITWVADANLALTSSFDANGLMNWWTAAQDWPASLNAASYLGTAGWRLPTAAEYQALFSASLVSTASPGPFLNVQTTYWTSAQPYRCLLSQNCASGGGYWNQASFDFSTGALVMGAPSPATELSAWAVRSGDIASVVPIPAAAWLLGSAVGLLTWLRRRAT
jgi:Protein of unknown function (DUF1566)